MSQWLCLILSLYFDNDLFSNFVLSTDNFRFPLWKRLINLAMADTQEIFKQHLIKDEVQINFWKDILHISVNYKLCSFLHELSNPPDWGQPVLILGVLWLYH